MQKKGSLTVQETQQKMEHYCAYQERCHQEVEKKLKSLGVIQIAQEEIIGHLIQNNYLNETRFAKSFARGKFRAKKWGKNRILRELKMRNISEYNIKKGLEEIPEEEYLATFYILFEKRKQAVDHLAVHQQKKKILDYLLYRGWDKPLIYDAIRENF
ncbi:MAG: regulatory protein RecX [Flavobacteriaceae bacterium]